MKQKKHHNARRRVSDLPVSSLENEAISKRNRLLATSLPPSEPLLFSDQIESTQDQESVGTKSNNDNTTDKAVHLVSNHLTLSTTEALTRNEMTCQVCQNETDLNQLIICFSCRLGYHTSCHPFPVSAIVKSNAKALFCCHVCLPKANHFDVDCVCKVPIRLGDLVECTRCKKHSHVPCVAGIASVPQPFACSTCSEKCLFEEMDRLCDSICEKDKTACEREAVATATVAITVSDHDSATLSDSERSCLSPQWSSLSSPREHHHYKMSLQNLLLNDLSESHSDDFCNFFEGQAMSESLPPRRFTLLDAVDKVEAIHCLSFSHLNSPRHDVLVDASDLIESGARLKPLLWPLSSPPPPSPSPSPSPSPPRSPILFSPDFTSPSPSSLCDSLEPLAVCNALLPEIESTDGFLMSARADLGRLYTQFRVPDEVLVRAFDLCRRLSERKLLKGPSTYAMTVSTFLIACRKEALPCTFAEIGKLANVSKKDLGRLTKLVLSSLQETMEPVSTESYVTRYSYKLGLDRQTTELVLFVVHRACERGDVDGRCPLSIIAAAIYCVSFIVPSVRKMTKRDIAETVGIAEVTITNSFRLMLPNLVYLFPKEYSAILPIDQALVLP